jgi:CheY-like chemotaxis protein
VKDTGGRLVLIVDDDADIRESLELLLGRHGYDVATAADGTEALEQLRAQRRKPCLILLDLMMPVMNGIELQAALESDPRLANIPVVVITGAGARVADRASARRHHVLAKPFDVSALLATVGRFCESGATATKA